MSIPSIVVPRTSVVAQQKKYYFFHNDETHSCCNNKGSGSLSPASVEEGYRGGGKDSAVDEDRTSESSSSILSNCRSDWAEEDPVEPELASRKKKKNREEEAEEVRRPPFETPKPLAFTSPEAATSSLQRIFKSRSLNHDCSTISDFFDEEGASSFLQSFEVASSPSAGSTSLGSSSSSSSTTSLFFSRSQTVPIDTSSPPGLFGAKSSNPYRRIDPQTLQFNPHHSIAYPTPYCDIPLSSDFPPSEPPPNYPSSSWKNSLKNSATKGRRKQRAGSPVAVAAARLPCRKPRNANDKAEPLPLEDFLERTQKEEEEENDDSHNHDSGSSLLELLNADSSGELQLLEIQRQSLSSGRSSHSPLNNNNSNNNSNNKNSASSSSSSLSPARLSSSPTNDSLLFSLFVSSPRAQQRSVSAPASGLATVSGNSACACGLSLSPSLRPRDDSSAEATISCDVGELLVLEQATASLEERKVSSRTVCCTTDGVAALHSRYASDYPQTVTATTTTTTSSTTGSSSSSSSSSSTSSSTSGTGSSSSSSSSSSGKHDALRQPTLSSFPRDSSSPSYISGHDRHLVSSASTGETQFEDSQFDVLQVLPFSCAPPIS